MLSAELAGKRRARLADASTARVDTLPSAESASQKSDSGDNPVSDGVFETVLALHLFGVIFWIGGLLMLASLLGRVPEEVGLPKERLLGTIRRLFEVVVNLGAAITIALGSVLILIRPEVLRQGWFHAKLLMVAIILFYHVRFYRRIRFLEDNPSASTRREFTVVHGVVSLLLLATLMLAILKPF
jgi:putative membrane protein